METKIYECGQELENLIRNQGWIETTDARDQQKGKKEFRKSRNSRTLIRFDYINLVVFENHIACNGIGGPRITSEELQLLFWYLHSNSVDKQTISNGHFDLDRARSSQQTMTSQLGYSKEFNRSTPESRKFERLLNKYSAVNLN